MAEPLHDVIFRVDGGNAYGVAMGHVYRCRRLAECLQGQNVRSHFMMKNLSPGIRHVQRGGFSITAFDDGCSDYEIDIRVLETAALNNAPVFIDLRRVTERFLEKARQMEVLTILYEDVYSEGGQPDILINSSPLPKPSYSSGKYDSDGSDFYSGMEYLVLSPELEKIPGLRFSSSIKNLFVSFGGADPCNLSGRITDLLLYRSDSFKIHLVAGPAYAHLSSLFSRIKNMDPSGRVTLYHDTDRFYSLAGACDAAVVAGGTTMFEMAALSVPSLVMPSIEHEAEMAKCLKKKGLVECVPRDVAQVPEIELSLRLDNFLTRPEVRSELYQNTLKLNLASGTSRVAEIICRNLKTRVSPITG